jgi:hypothetical protein
VNSLYIWSIWARVAFVKVLFQKNPYSILVGDQLYMLYVVSYILCFDLGSSSKFSRIGLPGDMAENVGSWFDYTVCEHLRGNIAQVTLSNWRLTTLLLECSSSGDVWQVNWTLDLVVGFSAMFELTISEYKRICELIITKELLFLRLEQWYSILAMVLYSG